MDLRCCDNMELLASLKDKQIDLAIIDPPYFSGPEKRSFYGSKESKIGVKRVYQKSESWQLPDTNFFDEIIRVSKYYIIWGCNYYNYNFHSGRIVWDKVNDSSDYSDCEIAATNIWDHTRIFRFMWNGMLQGSMSDGRKMEGNKKLNEKRIHPTQKPVQLYSWQLKKFMEKHPEMVDIVCLDTNMGSGSLPIACYELKVNIIACDNDKYHFDNATSRINAHMAQQKLF